MKQLTFIFILIFPFAFYHCTNLQSDSIQNQEPKNNSRSIQNINDYDCDEVIELNDELKVSTLPNLETTLNDSSHSSFQLPDLKNKKYKYFNNDQNRKRTQSLFDDYDPEKF